MSDLRDCSKRYRGRFAPSPSGPLHFGSLITAVGSYLDARSRGGEWCLRIDDLDPPRVIPGATDAILRTLEAYGFQWDGPVVFQSARTEAYAAAFATLQRLGVIYACGCSRREIADSIVGLPGASIYPGTCRGGLGPGKTARAFRVRTEGARIAFEDRLQGLIAVDLARETGDFIVLRADGPFAYQLAVVVDDAELGITDVVRGADLLDSTPRQIHLQRLLGLATPRYLHLPVVVNALGEKLSKQTLAPPLDLARPAPVLVAALAFLGQVAPAELAYADVAEVWRWALAYWDPARLPRLRAAPLPATPE
ncbi:tRNA glutamyl-Q(34) synthetase GluQRS [Thiobacter aerophilum]|uniref:Glutamyl-Q tRNA(Asp) synthetase n=1 Tax=Thiobacter aerophilum TaxID=3121275 RepID=A0ABV0EF40_9BURK